MVAAKKLFGEAFAGPKALVHDIKAQFHRKPAGMSQSK
jgi:hypothetical protein